MSETVRVHVTSRLIKYRPSNAAVRKMLRDKTIARRARCVAWGWLQYRKRNTRGR